MRVLITGGAGFIGGHLAHFLTRQKVEVLVLDDLSRGLAKNLPSEAILKTIEVGSKEASDVISEWRPDAIVHLAAQANVNFSLQNPVQDADINVLGTLRLLHSASLAGTQTFVSASSGGALYGEAEAYPTSEAAEVRPQSPYGASKYCTEVYSDLFARSTTMRCVSLRFSNVYGPRQSDSSESGVVSIFAKRMLENNALFVNGDGLQSRDYIYVADVVAAIFLSTMSKNLRGSFNIGTGVETTLLALIAALRKIVPGRQRVRFKQAIHGEVRRSSLDASLFSEKTGWKPQYSLEDGLRLTIEDFRKISLRTGKTSRVDRLSTAGDEHAGARPRVSDFAIISPPLG